MNRIDPPTSVVLVVDLQNDTVGQQGAFAEFGAAEFATRHGVVENRIAEICTVDEIAESLA